MDIVSRKAWGARAPRSSERLASTKGVKVHYVGDTVDPRLTSDHTRCVAMVRGIQASHMDDRGWHDIGYTALVCPHGNVFVGRGPHVLCAANGPGLNSGHYAVCGLVGDEGLTKPSEAMLNGIRDAIEWLRKTGDAGGEIRGHRDGYSTTCPGEPLYAWVKAGAPRPKGSTQEDDDVAAKDVWAYEIDAPWDDKDPRWNASTHLRVMHAHVRGLEAKVDALALDNRTLSGKVDQLLALLTPKP